VDLQIYAKNIALNAQFEDYVQKKFNRLERHLNSISDAKLEIFETSARSQADRVVAQLTLTTNGFTLRGQESGQNLYAAIDAVADVMDRQIRRYKTQSYRSSRGRRTARAESMRENMEIVAEPEPTSEDGELVEEFGTILRTKRFAMEPMTREDAITEMELLNHGFFLFFNSESKEFNVIYRRRDGGYGIIEPELT
jgi:putative sigma-54 modulation protein